MLIAWTSVETKETAETIARGAIEQGLAACVQIDGPLISLYRWEGKLQRSVEYRLCFKFLEPQAKALETFVKTWHPYSVPEWVVVQAEYVAEKYLSWASSVSTSSTL